MKDNRVIATRPLRRQRRTSTDNHSTGSPRRHMFYVKSESRQSNGLVDDNLRPESVSSPSLRLEALRAMGQLMAESRIILISARPEITETTRQYCLGRNGTRFKHLTSE
ncbi:hypothetical protein J6590_047677 [Homalodisca vitripennis]|nr:hypothetical protein J6590_047677 [Homalodisca vitripennis]